MRTVVKFISLVSLLVFLLWAGPVGAQIPTTEWVNFYSTNSELSGVPIPIGALIEVFDPDNVLCGSYTVTETSSYGFLACYFDDPNTTTDEGIEPGDRVSFEINGRNVGTFHLPSGIQNGDRFEVDLPISDEDIPLPPTQIPEPISLILFSTGLAGLAGYRILRRRHV